MQMGGVTRIRCPLKVIAKGMCCILTTLLSEELTLGNELLQIFKAKTLFIVQKTDDGPLQKCNSSPRNIR